MDTEAPTADTRDSGPSRLLAALVVLAAIVAVAVLLIDRGIKNQIIEEAQKLREAIQHGQRQDTAGPRGDRAGAVNEPGGVDAVDDDTGAPAASAENAPTVESADGDRAGGIPHRGGLDAG